MYARVPFVIPGARKVRESFYMRKSEVGTEAQHGSRKKIIVFEKYLH